MTGRGGGPLTPPPSPTAMFYVLAEERLSEVARFYPQFDREEVRRVLCAPAMPGPGWQGWIDAAPAWQVADFAAVALWEGRG